MKEEKLVVLCKKKKSSAQKKVFDEYAPWIRAVCRRYIDNADNAEEVLLEAFFRIFTKIEKFEWNGANSFKAWMKRVVINTSINFLKKQGNKFTEEPLADCHDIPISDADDDFFDGATSLYSKEDVLAAFAKIPEQYRLVMNMSILDEMKHKEIAMILNIAEETSRSRLTRGKRLFREILLENRTCKKHVGFS